MSSIITTAGQVLAVAAKEIGVREGRDANGNWNNRVKYTTWYANHPLIKNSAFLTSAWCAIFVSWVAAQVGAVGTLIPLHAWTPSGLAWFQKRGLATRGTGAKAGDVVYFYYPTKGRVAHVGFVESVSGGYMTTIEGNTNTTGSNQGNGVYRLRRRITENHYFAHPQYSTVKPAPLPTAPAPKPKVIGTVSVAHLKSARYVDPPKSGTPLGAYANEVFTLETALARTEWIEWKHVDGHYGSATVGDGSTGFGGATGFQKKHSGVTRPDGWLGILELQKLFRLAGMTVTVTK